MTDASVTPSTPRPVPPQWVRATRAMSAAYLKTGAWLWPLLLVGGAVVIVVVNAAGDASRSIFQYAFHGALWYPFALGVILASVHMTVHLANGLTRRAFVQAAAVTAVVTSVGYAVLTAAVLQSEKLLYQAVGWTHTTDPGMFAPGAGFLEVLWWTTLAYVPGHLSGLVVGVTYYRWGGIRATLALPLTLLPILLVSRAGVTAGQWHPFGVGWDLPALVVVAVSIAASGLVVVGLHLVVRRLPIRPTSAS